MMRFLGGVVGFVLWAIELIARFIRALLFAILFGAVLGGAICSGATFLATGWALPKTALLT